MNDRANRMLGSRGAKNRLTTSNVQGLIRNAWWLSGVISGLTLLIPFITGVITHFLSGMSHQVGFCQSHPTIFEQLYDFCQSQSHMNVAKKYRCEDGFMTPNIRPTKSLEMLVLGC